jgi:hypothetical protein
LAEEDETVEVDDREGVGFSPNAQEKAELTQEFDALSPLNLKSSVCLFELGHWESDGLILIEFADDVVQVDLWG